MLVQRLVQGPAAKNRFLFMCGIRHIGDKYIDGYEAAYYLGLDLLRVEP